MGWYVVFKVIWVDSVGSFYFVDWFECEVKVLVVFNYLNIVIVYDFGWIVFFYYLIMEFVDGVNFCEMIVVGKFLFE